MKKIIIVVISILPFCSLAASLTGNIVFDKRAPYTGVIYANGGSGPATSDLDQKNKVFSKNALVIGNGGEITFNNSDEFQHNIFANDSNTNVKFDVGLMATGQSTKVKADWAENTITRIGCKIHPKMRSYVVNVNSDAFQVLPFKKGTQSYDFNLDVAEHTSFTLAIPKYDSVTLSLTQGESKTVDVTYKGKKRASLTLALN